MKAFLMLLAMIATYLYVLRTGHSFDAIVLTSALAWLGVIWFGLFVRI